MFTIWKRFSVQLIRVSVLLGERRGDYKWRRRPQPRGPCCDCEILEKIRDTSSVRHNSESQISTRASREEHPVFLQEMELNASCLIRKLGMVHMSQGKLTLLIIPRRPRRPRADTASSSKEDLQVLTTHLQALQSTVASFCTVIALPNPIQL